MNVVWLGNAIDDLATIREYISAGSPLNAERFTESLYIDISIRLEQFPRAGRKIPEKNNDEYREIIHGNYRVMYRIRNEEVRILAVRNSNQLFTGEEIE
jgi:toxin ParE1/3/4